MFHLRFNSREYILSRNRNGVAELVDLETAKVLQVPATSLAGVPKWMVDKVAVPDTVLFLDRPREFLAQLRKRREVFVELRKMRKVREKKPPGSRTRTRVSKASEKTEQALARFNPDDRAELLAALKELKKK